MEPKSEMYEMGMLMDFYGSLLTRNTLDVMDMYYSQDMSLAEIGEALGISRQGAHSFITKGKQQLLEFESKLGMYGRFRKIKTALEDIQADLSLIDTEAVSGYEKELVEHMRSKITDVIAEL